MVSTAKSYADTLAMMSGITGMTKMMADGVLPEKVGTGFSVRQRDHLIDDTAEAHRSLVQRAAAQLSPGIASADALVVLRLNGWDLATIDQIFADVMTELEVM